MPIRIHCTTLQAFLRSSHLNYLVDSKSFLMDFSLNNCLSTKRVNPCIHFISLIIEVSSSIDLFQLEETKLSDTEGQRCSLVGVGHAINESFFWH